MVGDALTDGVLVLDGILVGDGVLAGVGMPVGAFTTHGDLMLTTHIGEEATGVAVTGAEAIGPTIFNPIIIIVETKTVADLVVPFEVDAEMAWLEELLLTVELNRLA